MSALNNQTNINTGRFYFATQLDGEQQLFTSNTGVAPAESTYIGISGAQGNQVLVSQMPTFEGTDWVSGAGALFAGTNSSYLTLSTIATSATGASMSIDRISGSGTVGLEAYGTNGTTKGIEFLQRGVSGALISSIAMNGYISTLGYPGAMASLDVTNGLTVETVRSYSNIVPISATATVPVFPATKFNTEFGQGTGIPIAGASNQATPYVVLFSTPVSGLNPNTQSLLNINFINSLSSGSNAVNYKVGFSTATAYTNILQTSLVPGLAGSWAPSGVPSATTPQGATNICAMLDSDGLNPNGTGFLYVAGQLANPNAAADLIYVKKGSVTEPTRNALVVRPV